jgi:small subunit ribosomal protein S21
MLIVELKEGDNIDKALKKLKRKFEKTGIAKQVKARQFYVKPSEKEREKKAKSLYKQQRITKSLNA